MAQQKINPESGVYDHNTDPSTNYDNNHVVRVGTQNAGNGDPLRTAMLKINEAFDKTDSNFDEVYSALAAAGGDLSAIASDIIPADDNTYNIGSPDNRWKHGYFASGSLYVGDIKLSNDNGRLLVQQVTDAGLITEAPVPNTPGVVTTDRLVNGNMAITLNSSGSLQPSLLLPASFTAVLDSEHMTRGVGLTEAPWELQVEWQVGQNGEVQTYINNIFPNITNPGYITGDEFVFVEADHGIPGYTFTVTLNNLTLPGGAGWTANLAVNAPPEYPALVNSTGAIKFKANAKSFVFGTDGSLTLPNNPTITATGNIEILAGNYVGINAGDYAQVDIGVYQKAGAVVVGNQGTGLVVRGRTEFANQDTTFGLPLDSAHYLSGPNVFNGSGAVSLALTLNRTGITYNWSIATLQLNDSVQGYQVGDTFTFEHDVHGIFDHTVTVTIDSLTEVDPGVWELVASVANPTVTLAEAAKIRFTDTVGVRVGDKTWLFDTSGDITLPAAGDIRNSLGVSVLGGGGGSSNQLVNGLYDVTLDVNGNTTFPTQGYIRQSNSYTRTFNGTNISGAPTVIWTGTNDNITSVKMTIQIEGYEGGDTSGWHTQTCEAVIAERYWNNAGTLDPTMSVYGVVHTSVDPLATFTVQRNPTTHFIEVVATPTGTAFGTLYPKVHSVELGTRD